MPFTVIGHGRYLLPVPLFFVGLFVGLVVAEETTFDLPPLVCGMALLAVGALVCSRCERTVYGDTGVTYRAILRTTRVEIGDLREIVLIGGAGRRGKTCLGFRRDGTKVELGPAGGSIVPRSTHSFEDAINGWAASHSISITRGPGWR